MNRFLNIFTFLIASYHVYRFKYLFNVFTILIFLGCSENTVDASKIEKGVLDLSYLDFSQANEIILQGDGLFYWKQFPKDDNGNFDASLLTKESKVKWPPAIWTNAGYEPQGHGTYRLILNQKEIDQQLVLNFDKVLGAVEVWANGTLLKKAGKLSKDGSNEEIDGRPLRVVLPREDNLDIILLVSCHQSRLGGGFSLQNRLQTLDSYEKSFPRASFIEGFITLLIVLFGGYQIYRFYAFKTNSYYLYFGLFCLVGASRQFFVGENIIYYFFPDVSYAVIQKMRYIGYFGGLPLIFLYHNALFPKYLSKLFLKVMWIIPVLGILYVFFSPVYYGTFVAPFFQVFGLFTLATGLYLVIRAVLDQKPYAKWILIGLLLMALTFVNDILYAMLVIQSAYIVNYSVLFYVIFQVYINHKIQSQKEKLLVSLASDISKLKTDVTNKVEEIETLRMETFQQIKSKEKLVDDLRKVKLDDSSVSIPGIIANLQSELLEDSQLLKLKSDIESLNYEFINRLKAKHPNLTKTDLEICTYLRMELGRTEIARLRFTSTEAVRKSRHRIRKKMNLNSDTDLDNYIKSI